jgi:hypothetical protein
MNFPNLDDNYEDAKYKAEVFYKSIGNIWCPALGDFVIFNNAGFLHLIEKNRKNRAKNEQKRRFFMLRYAKDILNDLQPVSNDDILINGIVVRYWKFMSMQDVGTIKIVVRQFGEGAKHFLSVYGRIKKPRDKA